MSSSSAGLLVLYASLIVLLVLVLVFVAAPSKFSEPASGRDTSVQILVLGDVGRSPRMQYHAISLAKHGASVHIVGFLESDVHPQLRGNPLVRLVPLSFPPRFLNTHSKAMFVLYGPLKVIWQFLNLSFVLCYRIPPSRWLMVQNPPSIPVLAIAWATCLMRNTTLVIDWHNFGWSILSLRLGSHHPMVTLAEQYERLFGRLARYHLTVSHAMSKWLCDELHVSAVTLHDRPSEDFQPLSSVKRIETLHRLKETAPYAMEIETGARRLIVSSTSWTADEDFSLLLDALVGYCAQVTKKLPKLLAIITGKGPKKDHYLDLIRQLNDAGKLSHVTVVTGWLSTADYASLLGAADVGVSLHKSTSGLDLPMKVVDMFGAGLPVIGYSKYESWPELVREGVNGRGFSNADELINLFVDLFSDKGEELNVLRDGALRESERRWDHEWDASAGSKIFNISEVD